MTVVFVLLAFHLITGGLAPLAPLAEPKGPTNNKTITRVKTIVTPNGEELIEVHVHVRLEIVF